ncbi:MAG: hypothetical protein AABX96_01425 [Nanoarchaeota archaeon]
MAKTTAWLVTLIGVILVLEQAGVTALESFSGWLVALAVLVIGVTKLMRNYKK